MTKETATASNNSLVKIVIDLWAGVILGAVIIGILVLTGIIPLLGSTDPSVPPGEPQLAQLESGTMAPDVPLADLDGGEVRLADYQGKVVVVNFWATWCGPCIQEMPMFQEYQDNYPEMVLLGVDEEESPQLVKDFLQQLQIDYTILLDQKGDMGKELRVSFLPTTIFLDETGEIRFRHYGIMSPDQMDYYLTTLGVIPE